jgi:hypothetical protein
VRDGIWAAESFIDADRVKMRGLAGGHVNERQEEAKPLTADVDAGDQRDGYQFSKPGVIREDLQRGSAERICLNVKPL